VNSGTALKIIICSYSADGTMFPAREYNPWATTTAIWLC